MDGTINSITANHLKMVYEMPYEDLKKMCFLLKKSDNEIYRQFSCKKDQSEDSLREILGNVVLHNHKVTVRDEKKVKPLTKIKDILDTRIENINDKNNPISTFLVVVTTILMSKWWVLKNGEKKGVA